MGFYLVMKDETFKLNKSLKNLILRLARQGALIKTLVGKDENLSQHVYVNVDDADNIARALVCEIMQRSIPPDALILTMDKIEELWKFAKERTTVFTLESHSYISEMLCELAGTQSASKIDLMVSNFNLIRDLYEMAGFNMRRPDHLFYESSDPKSMKTDPKSLEFKTG